MDVILRIMNKITQESLFIDENLNTYNKDDIISLLKQQKVNNLALAKRNGKAYIKSKPNIETADNISRNSISHIELISYLKIYNKAIADQRMKKYDAARRKQAKKYFIIVMDNKGDFTSTKTNSDIENHLKKHKNAILKAAKEQNIDPYLLGAILIDEYCRMGWDDWLDWLGALGLRDTSVGIAQIKLSTAREILKKQYYNPAPGKITPQSPPAQIWFYLNQPEHSIHFAAAAIRLSIAYWRKRKIDISKQPKVLAYLYSYGYTKDTKGAVVKRCIQISTEFYRLAKAILL